VLVYKPEEIAQAINENTGDDLYHRSWREATKGTRIAKEHKIPMLLDDAAGIPRGQRQALCTDGIDLYCFSGGKACADRNAAGLLLGRKDLVERRC